MPRSPATAVSSIKRQEPAERRPKVLDERIGDDAPIAAHAGPLERSPSGGDVKAQACSYHVVLQCSISLERTFRFSQTKISES